jgi:hypothetical protein
MNAELAFFFYSERHDHGGIVACAPGFWTAAREPRHCK